MLAIAVSSVVFVLGLGFVAAFYALDDLEEQHRAPGSFDSASSASSLQVY